MSATQYPVICICGSMRFWDNMLLAAQQWTAAGWIVLMPFIADYVGGKEPDKQKIMLDDMHKTKISMSQRILIITNNTGYIGESTRNEIQYAEEHGLTVTYK